MTIRKNGVEELVARKIAFYFNMGVTIAPEPIIAY